MGSSSHIRRLLLIVLALAPSASLWAAQLDDQASRLQQAVHLMETRGDYAGAIAVFEEIAAGEDRDTAARALLYMAICYEQLDPANALDVYARLIERYADKRVVIAEATSRLQALQRELQVRPEPGPSATKLLDRSAMSVSADGRFLSYIDWGSLTGNVVVHEIGTEQPRPVTTEADGNRYGENPIVSPDGNRVAYAWTDFHQEPYTFELRVANVDGSGSRQLYQRPEEGIVPVAWTLDGSQILTMFWGGEDIELALISVDDGSARYLESFGSEWLPNGFAISPDAGAILYDAPSRDDPMHRDIFLLPTDGGPARPLITGPANEVWPLMVPGGQAVLFLSDRSGTMALWAAAIEGGEIVGEPALVKPDMDRTRPLGVTRGGELFYLVFLDGFDIHVTEVDVESGQRLAPVRQAMMLNTGRNLAPAWSPDGTELASIAVRGPHQLESQHDRLTVVDMRTGQHRTLAPELHSFRSPSWSPDGSAIRVNANGSAEGLYEVDAQSGELTPLLTDRGYLGRPAFSADGTRVYYQQRRTLWEHDFTTGETRRLYDDIPQAKGHPSPDGTQVAVWERGDRSLVLIPVDGGPPGIAARFEGPEIPAFFYGWSSDGSGLYYSVRTEETELQLWYLSLEDGERQQLDVTTTGLEVSFHPDGRQVAFTNRSTRFAVWKLQDFLPDFGAQR